jgi:hypothetical protein
MSFFLADRIPADSILLCGLDPVSAEREQSDPLFCSEIEERMTAMLTQRGLPVNPNPRWFLSYPAAHQDLPSRMLDLEVLDAKTGKVGVLEIDGHTYHAHRRAEDAARDAVLNGMGLRFIQRYSAAACYHDPFGVVEHFKEGFRKFCDNDTTNRDDFTTGVPRRAA